MTGSALQCLDVAFPQVPLDLSKWGGGPGEEGLNIPPGGRLADDGKCVYAEGSCIGVKKTIELI